MQGGIFMNLKNRVIFITGASSGIGRETALAAGRRQASVVLAARRKDRLEEAAVDIERAGGQALVVSVDVTRPEEVKNGIRVAFEKFKRIDVLINNAGVGSYGPVEEISADQMERIWRTNFMGTFYAIQEVLPLMKKQGSGHIITVSSMVGKRGAPLQSAYSATKFAQAGLMESLRMELRNSPIRTTVVYPGVTETEFVSKIENRSSREIRHPLKPLSAARVAEAIIEMIHHPKPELYLQSFGRTLAVLNSANPKFVDWAVGSFVKKKI
jgi:short-subunit dehydrogenase